MPDFRSYLGNTIEIDFDCLLDQVLTDPANILVKTYDPTGVVAEYTYGLDDEIEKPGVGQYKFFMETLVTGTWKVVIRLWGGPYRKAATKDYIVTVDKTVFTEYP